MDWDKLVQIIVNGLTLGSVYALVALGFSMVYGILKLLNFAHGDVMMVGAFVGWGVLGRFGGSRTPRVAGRAPDRADAPGGDVGVRRARASRSSGSPTARCVRLRASRR